MSTLAGVQKKLTVVQKQENNGRNLTRKVRAEFRQSAAHCARVQKKLKVVQKQVEENKRALLGRNMELQNNVLDVDFQVYALVGVGSEFLDDGKKSIVLNCLNHAKANKLHIEKQVAALQLDVECRLGDEALLKEQYIQSKSQTDMLFGRLAICDLLFGRLAPGAEASEAFISDGAGEEVPAAEASGVDGADYLETGNEVDLADLAERDEPISSIETSK